LHLIQSLTHTHTSTHTHTHTYIHSVGFLGREIGPSQTPLPDNTQHSQETDIYAPGEFRTRNPDKRAAADPYTARPPGSALVQVKGINLDVNVESLDLRTL
jgi:hypothetical protein